MTPDESKNLMAGYERMIELALSGIAESVVRLGWYGFVLPLGVGAAWYLHPESGLIPLLAGAMVISLIIAIPQAIRDLLFNLHAVQDANATLERLKKRESSS